MEIHLFIPYWVISMGIAVAIVTLGCAAVGALVLWFFRPEKFWPQ